MIILSATLAAQFLVRNGRSSLPSSASNAVTGSATAFNYAVVILMENQNYADIIGSSSAPYINSLSSSYGLATNYHDLTSPSLPNYLALTGGSTFGCGGYDGSPNSNGCTGTAWAAKNVVDLIETKGMSWKAYMETMPSNCYGSDSSSYYVRHNPFVYYSDIVNSPARCSKVVPSGSSASVLISDLGSTSTASNFMWFTPNGCNDMHDCSVSTGDTYLAGVIPKILTSSVFTTQRAVLFLTWDENSYIPAIWAGPAAKTAFTSTTNYNHYSFLSTLETVWSLGNLGQSDVSAPAMTEFFTTAEPGGLTASFTSSPLNPIINQAVSFPATATGGTAPYTYSWTFGDGSTGTGQNPTHSYTAPNTFSVTLTVKDSASPQNTATSTNTVLVALLPPPPGSAPTLVGWGGVRLDEAAAGSAGLGSTSNVFPGESISALEADVQKFQSLGYNTVRVSFQNQCNSPMPQLGPYSATNLDRAIKVAKYYNLWIIVDWHGYHDLEPSYLSCWLSTWKGIVQQFSGSYLQIVWEPENEPIGGSNSSGASISLSVLSSGYQQWINQARGLGDTHYIVVPNLCVYTCNGWPSAAATSWPTVNDTVGHIFINMHTYMYYPYWSGQGWNNSTADSAANTWYQTVLQGMKTTGWTALNTEAGADWISGSPPDVVVPGPGTVSATITTIHFVQRLTYLNDHNSPRIGWVLWPAGLWTTCCNSGGLYGALQPGGWGNQITLLSLNLRADFGISNYPRSMSIAQGSSGTSVISIASLNALTSSISLSALISPPGPTISLNSSTVNVASGGTGASTLKVAATDSTPVGGYTVTVTGTSGTLTHSITLSLSVAARNATPSASSVLLICNPSSVQVGSQTSCSITVVDTSNSPTIPSGAVFLSTDSIGSFGSSGSCDLAPGIPAGTATCSITYIPSAVGGGVHVITGNYGGDAAHGTSSGSFTLVITAVSMVGDFSIVANQTSLTINQGVAGLYNLTLVSNGYAGSVNLLPTISPNITSVRLRFGWPIDLKPFGTPYVLLRVFAANDAPVGIYTITAIAIGGGHRQSVQLTLHVGTFPNSPNDFGIFSSINTLTVTRNSAGSYILTLASYGFAGPVTLSALLITNTGGVELSFGWPIDLKGGGTPYVPLIASLDINVPLGTYTIIVTATGGGHSHSTLLTLQVTG